MRCVRRLVRGCYSIAMQQLRWATVLITSAAFACGPSTTSNPTTSNPTSDDAGATPAPDSSAHNPSTPTSKGSDAGSATPDAGSSDGATSSTAEAGADGATQQQQPQPPTPPSGAGVMPLISQGVPAFANSGSAADAVDADYGTAWRTNDVPSSSSPDWIALDLSKVPQASRTKVYSLWFNEWGYNYVTSDAQSYNLPGDYQIQANAAPGGGQAPSTNWVTLVTVSGNELSSGAHMLDLTGYSWVRFVCTATAANTASGNLNTAIQWELYDAHANDDGWKFAGDSITANSMGHQSTNDSFDQLVHQQVTNDPAFEMAGHGYWSTSTLLGVIDSFIADFPGRYFAIPLGTNDAPGNDPAGFAANMTALINKVLAAGKVPVVPTIPYTGDPQHASIPQYNAQIQALYTQFGSKLVPGPDLYTVIYNGRATMFDNPGDLHPNAAGNAAIRQAWANAMAHAVYGK